MEMQVQPLAVLPPPEHPIGGPLSMNPQHMPPAPPTQHQQLQSVMPVSMGGVVHTPVAPVQGMQHPMLHHHQAVQHQMMHQVAAPVAVHHAHMAMTGPIQPPQKNVPTPSGVVHAAVAPVSHVQPQQPQGFGPMQTHMMMQQSMMMAHQLGPDGSLSVFEQAREIKKGRNVKNARGPKVFKPVKWDTKLTPDENVKCLPVLRLQKPETHTIGKFAKGGNHFCQLPSCPILAEKAARPLKAGKTKKAQRCKCDFYCEVCMVVLHPFPCFDIYHGRKPHSNVLHTDS